MSDDAWRAVKEAIGHYTLNLGPHFAQQALENPLHLLFSLSRYKFAAKLLPQQSPVSVLELGCSEGLGTLMLAEKGCQVTAVDFDKDAIAHAQQTIKKANISFICADFLGHQFGNFHAVISLDVIEHIPQSNENIFLETLYKNLHSDGFCLVGTPNVTAAQYASKASQVGHVNLFTAERLTSLVTKYFRHVFVFGMNDEVLHTGFYPMCHYLFALGCGKRNNDGR
ncbi:MAG: class I SAM-dependent methyltransferase [Nitrososphaerales archaeon]